MAAVRWFPQSELAIRRLMLRLEAFVDMCEELADAEKALSKVSEIPADLREARRNEWQEIVDGLVCEVGKALRESEARQRGEYHE